MRIKGISTAATVKIIIFLFLSFVMVGDIFLPEPLKSASKDTKQSINNFVLSLIPQKRPTNPNERTEKAVEELEQGAGQK